MSEIYNHYSGRNLGRVQGLADGVFAVAMTLLVLDLRLPGLDGGADTDHALWSQLNDLGPSLSAYLLSFTMLGTFWLALHAVLDLCRESDRTLSWAVLGFLFFVTTLPFTASVLASHTHLGLAVALYWTNLAALGATLAWAITHARTLVVPERMVGLSLVRRRLVLAQGLYAAAALVAIVSPVASIVALALVQVLFIVSPRTPFRA